MDEQDKIPGAEPDSDRKANAAAVPVEDDEADEAERAEGEEG